MSTPRRFDWLFRPQLPDEDLPLSAEARFAEALAELPPVERSALALAEIGGLGPEEIAERLGTQPAIVSSILARARLSVRITLARGRGLTAFLPFHGWWQSGASAPLGRAAGVVATAAVGAGLAVSAATPSAPPALPVVEEPAHAVVAKPRATVSQASFEARNQAVPGELVFQEHKPRPTQRPTMAAAVPAPPRAVPAPAPPAARTVPAGRPIPPAREPAPAPPERAPAATPARPSAGEVDRPPSLPLVRVPPVPSPEVGEDHVDGPVLDLPEVAQLVREQVVGSVLPPHEDRPEERIPVIAP